MNTIDLLNLQVCDVMISPVKTVAEDTLLKLVEPIFDMGNIHHIPVLDHKNKLVGIISKSDMFLLLDWGTRLNLAASLRKNDFLLTSTLAGDIMEKKVQTLLPTDKIIKCVQIFKENHFRALPVVDEYSQLVGIISTYDLINLAYTEDSVK